jgi:hypothetical protein
MDHLSEALRTAVADPPPTGINLDRLIRGERRARQRRWFVGAVAAVAVLSTTVVTAVVRAPAGLGVGGLPSPTKTNPGAAANPVGACAAVRPAPTGSTPTGEKPGRGGSSTSSVAPPTEPSGAAVARLSSVLNAAIRLAMPNVSVTDDIHPDCEGIQFEPDVYPALYYASFEAKDAQGVGIVVVMVHHVQFVAMDSYVRHENRPDGTRIGWNEEAQGAGTRGLHGEQVSVLRPDGTFVTALSQNITGANYDVFTRPTAPATTEQLIDIAADPGLTLYP